MQNINIAMDKVAALASGQWLAQKGESPAVSFQALFAQLTTDKPDQALAAVPKPEPAQPAAESPSPQPATALPAPETPVVQLRQSLEQTGQPLERFSVPAKARDKLEQVLVQSGYSRQQAKEIMNRASEDDGSVNLGTMFALLPQYQPESGPMFMLSEQDKPLLIQVLKDLGCTESEIDKFVDSLENKDGKLVVTGLPALLAKAQARNKEMPEQPSVDPEVLGDLLVRLGMDQKEVGALLGKATDGQGRTNAKAVLALFAAAAQRQESGQTQSLTQLAAKIEVKPAQGGQPSDAAKLKAEVMQILQNGAPRAATQAQAQTGQGGKVQAQAGQVQAGQAQAGQAQASQAAAAAQDQVQVQVQASQAEAASPAAQNAAQNAAQGQAHAADQAAQQAPPAVQGSEQPALGEQAAERAEAKAGNQAEADKGGLERVLADRGAPAPQAAAGKGSGQQAAGDASGQQSAQSQGHASAQARAAQAMAAPAAAGVKAGAAQAQNGQTAANVQAAVEAAGRTAQAAQTAQARGPLPAYVVRQVSQQIAQMVKSQQNQLRLELRPPELGELNLKLSVKNGVVRLTMTADSLAAKHALDSGLHDLRAQLVQQGLKPDRLEVMLSPDAERQLAQQQSGAGQDGRGSGFGRGRDGAGAAAGDDQEPDAAAPILNRTWASSRINLFA